MTRILSLGMAVLDHVFRVTSLPHAGEKYRADDYTTHVGGPALIGAATVARLGGASLLCARLGEDANSGTIMRELDAIGIDKSLMIVKPDIMAPVSSVYVDLNGERQIVNFRGRNLPVSPDILTETMLDGIDAVLVDQRWPEGAARLAKMARQRSIPVLLDAENDLDALTDAMEHSSHIVFSEPGLREFSGCADSPDGLRTCAAQFDAWLGVTLGAKGMLALAGGKLSHVETFQVKPVDTLGAGDVWHGAFALCLGEGQDELKAARFANATAALKCSRGSGWKSIPDRQEVQSFLSSMNARTI